MKDNEKHIRRCLELAKNGFGTSYPNPMVGSLIVYNGKIIGEGWHLKSGEAHAEVNAIKAVKDKSLLEKSTIYVSLEPCSHFGKTPPCCDLIIKNKIPNVVVGTVDPNSKVAGTGIARLIEAGINVQVGILEEECNELNKRFFMFHKKQRPYIILKWAESSEGFMAPKDKTTQQPVWITNEFSRQLVHKWRTQEQAILVGTNTVIDDNPRLDARDWFGNNPVKIILDPNNRISESSNVFKNSTKTILISKEKRKFELENFYNEIIDFKENTAKKIVSILYKHQIQSVIVEGGYQTIQAFINENLWDEAIRFIGNKSLKDGLKAPNIDLAIFEKTSINNDTLIYYRND